jgi:hypothetical protein
MNQAKMTDWRAVLFATARLDQDPDPARSRLLDFPRAEAAALWLLEHGA